MEIAPGSSKGSAWWRSWPWSPDCGGWRSETRPGGSNLDTPCGASAHDVGVQLTGVKARGATVARVSAPAAGVVIDDSEFIEDLNIQDVAVGQEQARQSAASSLVVGSQLTNVNARDIKVETHLHTPGDPSQPDPDTLRHSYLDRLYQQVNALALAGIDPKAAADAEAGLELAAVYTALLTQTPEVRLSATRPSAQSRS